MSEPTDADKILQALDGVSKQVTDLAAKLADFDRRMTACLHSALLADAVLAIENAFGPSAVKDYLGLDDADGFGGDGEG